MGKVLTGTASWTDPTLLQTDWYPDEAETPEERLKYYASRFPLVEVDSTYYGLPAERTAVLWADRTPTDFTFDFKAFRLFTGHPTPLKAIPNDIRSELPADMRDKPNVYANDVPKQIMDEVYERFRAALMPVHSAGKMGAVFVQYPKWYFYSRENLVALSRVREHLPDYRIAVEFRQPSWLNDRNRDTTLGFLREHNIAYTCVDEPQGTAASVLPIAVATADFAVIRFHGRRQETWDKRGVGVQERFKYLYTDDELSEWVPKIRQLQHDTHEVHALMNNCYADYGVRNAQQLGQLLQADGVLVASAG